MGESAMTDMPTVIAIDGYAASGKSTLARRLAGRLGYRIMDTGAMYRAFTWAALAANVPAHDEDAAAALARETEISIHGEDGAGATVNGRLLDPADLRGPEVEHEVSNYSRIAGVRAALTEKQRDFAREGRAILVGRDIGTVVCPEARVKFFLHADEATRSQRRENQQQDWGLSGSASEARTDIATRDRIDSQRASAPLRAADDAIHIDTTSATPDEVFAIALQAIEAAS
jgi:cytidylate kinase